MSKPLGLQMYTVRDMTQKDFVGTLKKVAEIGYDGVEFAGYGNISAKDMRHYLDEFGIVSAGSHVGINDLEDDIEGVIDYNRTIGTRFITCPYLPLDKVKCLDDIKAYAYKLNNIGRKITENGFIFSYHNHSHEFKKMDGKYILDILYELTDPQYVKAEIDTYWVKRGGEDPVEYVKKYSGRIPIIHLKDLNENTNKDTEILDGTINFKEIFKIDDDLGIEWYIVEQEDFDKPSIKSVEISYNNLRAAGIGLKNK